MLQPSEHVLLLGHVLQLGPLRVSHHRCDQRGLRVFTRINAPVLGVADPGAAAVFVLVRLHQTTVPSSTLRDTLTRRGPQLSLRRTR